MANVVLQSYNVGHGTRERAGEVRMHPSCERAVFFVSRHDFSSFRTPEEGCLERLVELIISRKACLYSYYSPSYIPDGAPQIGFTNYAFGKTWMHLLGRYSDMDGFPQSLRMLEKNAEKHHEKVAIGLAREDLLEPDIFFTSPEAIHYFSWSRIGSNTHVLTYATVVDSGNNKFRPDRELIPGLIGPGVYFAQQTGAYLEVNTRPPNSFVEFDGNRFVVVGGSTDKPKTGKVKLDLPFEFSRGNAIKRFCAPSGA
ncbi:MAG: hypothetical protein ABIA63_00435, partial [bacterium]